MTAEEQKKITLLLTTIFFWTTNLLGLVSDVVLQRLFHHLQVVRFDIFWDFNTGTVVLITFLPFDQNSILP